MVVCIEFRHGRVHRVQTWSCAWSSNMVVCIAFRHGRVHSVQIFLRRNQFAQEKAMCNIAFVRFS